MRTARKTSSSGVYHVFARGVGRQLIFEDAFDRTYFLEKLRELLGVSEIVLYAWCLMDNHYHLLLGGSLGEIGDFVRSLNGSHALRFNKRHDRVGHLFQGRFKSEPVEDDSYLMTVVRYIHENPLKAGLAATSAYPWSSYAEYVDGSAMCQTGYVLDIFGGLKAFEDFHSESDLSSREACLDEETPRASRMIAAEELAERAERHFPDVVMSEVASFGKAQRNECLRAMKRKGFSVREIERLTGVGRSIIHRA